MKNQLRMPKMDNVKGIEKDLVKLAYKLLSNGGTIEESIEDRTVKVSISSGDYTMSLMSHIPRTAVEILHYGFRGFSVAVNDANDVRLQYHSDTDRSTVQCIGELIDDTYDLNKKDESKDADVKFEAFLKD